MIKRIVIKDQNQNIKETFVGTLEEVTDFLASRPTHIQRESDTEPQSGSFETQTYQVFDAQSAQWATKTKYFWQEPIVETIEEVDITAESALEALVNKNLARMKFGQQVMAELAAMNQQALVAQEITVAQIIAAEEKLSKVQRLLLNGSTSLALAELNALSIPELPAQTKTYFEAKIANFLAQ